VPAPPWTPQPPDRTHPAKDQNVPSLPLDGFSSLSKEKKRSETDGTAAASGRPKSALDDWRWRSGGPVPCPRGTTRQGLRSLLSNSPGACVGPPPGSQHLTSNVVDSGYVARHGTSASAKGSRARPVAVSPPVAFEV
jgi:hypothetical protein